MEPIGIALRRTLLVLLLAVGLAAVVSWRRGQPTPTPAEPPQWPPWPQRQDAPESAPVPPAASEPAASELTLPAPAASEPPSRAPAWLVPLGDGTAPESHPIKVKLSSGIFHVPGGRLYDRTRADRCYQTAAAAEADGYRRSKT